MYARYCIRSGGERGGRLLLRRASLTGLAGLRLAADVPPLLSPPRSCRICLLHIPSGKEEFFLSLIIIIQ